MTKPATHPLAALGPTLPWQAALLLPEHYLDLTHPAQSMMDFDDAGEKRPIVLRLVSNAQLRWPNASHRARRPWTVFDVRTPAGEQVGATLFGDTREYAEQLVTGAELAFLASSQDIGGRASLTLHELLAVAWVGRHRPHYAGKPRVITPDRVRDLVMAELPTAITPAADFLRKQLTALGPEGSLLRDLGAEGWSLEQLLQQSHTPASTQHAELAARVLRRIAALGALQRLPGRSDGVAPAWPLPTLAARLSQQPFTLTDEQAEAIRDVALNLASGRPTNHLITGEVGSGKTIVALVIAAAMCDAGGRVVILEPNARLAGQIAEDMRRFFPDCACAVITAESDDDPDGGARLLVGTTALLHRNIASPDLLVVDEQHRFARQQREQLIAAHTHMIEMTATPIPRTQALLQLGKASCSQMRQTHAPKVFYTRLYEGTDAMRTFFNEIRPTIRAGDPLLVVYPRREGAEETGDPETAPDPTERYSVNRAFQRWNEMYPGKVAAITASDDDATKQRVLDDFACGRVPICLTTTFVETGLNISSLYRIVIVCPERYGLTQLHQLRGRTARQGGDGYCELLCPEPLSVVARARLQVFLDTTDGFALAEMDLRARGAGDLTPESLRQSGADGTCLFGVKLDAELFSEAAPVLDRWTAQGG